MHVKQSSWLAMIALLVLPLTTMADGTDVGRTKSAKSSAPARSPCAI